MSPALLTRRSLPVLAVALGFLIVPTVAASCPFCSADRGPTLIGDYNQAAMVLVGTFTNPKLGTGGGFEGSGTTDFVIEEVLKSHDILAKKTMLTLPKYVPPSKSKFVIFCDVYKGLIDPYRGVEVPEKSDLVRYLRGALERKDRPVSERLRYCFDFLNSPELEVGIDAYREYARADYEDYRTMAAGLPADMIAAWLGDSRTSPFRYGLYASLLGLSGNLEHGKLLRAMIDDPAKRKGSGIDGMLVGYETLLHRHGMTKEALDHLRGLLGNAKQDFAVRYAVLRTARFFWTSRPDVFTKSDLVDTVALALPYPDMADFAIEDLAKWGRWEMADRILDLAGKQSVNSSVIKRAVIRYALRCPTPRAAAFVRQERLRDPEVVNDLEELLRMEAPASPGNTTNAKNGK